MPVSDADTLDALLADARAGRKVDVARLAVLTEEDEGKLPAVIAAMSASKSEFSHSFKVGAKLDSADVRWITDYRDQLLAEGLTDIGPDARLKQSAQDLLLWASRVAQNLAGNGLSAFDLVQETAIGLTEALLTKWPNERYGRGVRLWCEYRALAALVREPDWIVYPASELAMVDSYLRAKRDFATEGVTDPSDEQLAGKMGVPEADASKAASLVAAQAKTGRPFLLPD